jgi:hypothetical protein
MKTKKKGKQSKVRDNSWIGAAIKSGHRTGNKHTYVSAA